LNQLNNISPHSIENLDFIEQYLYLEEIDSTNSYAKELKNFPKSGLFVIRAVKQSGGRGRREKTFFSEHSGGLWVSIIAPVTDISEHFIYNRALSLAICETLKSIDPSHNDKISIKWPNDIYWKDRKIAGILLENMPATQNAIIAGFGLNINILVEDFPVELRQSATSILIETGQTQSLDRLLERILESYWNFSHDNRQSSVHERYTKNLYKKGCPAVVDSRQGTFLTVEVDGQLRLKTSNGDVLCSSGTLRFLETYEVNR
jgi:BirA family biotin operon repressor/biotin-[acetyl-CoA-carboxylase] ligase